MNILLQILLSKSKNKYYFIKKKKRIYLIDWKAKKLFCASRLWRGSLCLKNEMVNLKVIKVLSIRTPRTTEFHNNIPRSMSDSLREGDIFNADQWRFIAGEMFIEWTIVIVQYIYCYALFVKSYFINRMQKVILYSFCILKEIIFKLNNINNSANTTKARVIYSICSFI